MAKVTVTVCDRCGKPISLTGMRTLTFRKILLHGRLFEPFGVDTSNYDLCPDCASELDKFFEGKATDAVVKE
jgi:hypothetical protein